MAHKLTLPQENMIAEMHTYNKRGYGFYPYPQEREMINKLLKLGVIVETIEDGYFVAEYKQPKVAPIHPESEPVPQVWIEMTVGLPVGAVVVNLYGQKRTITRFCNADTKQGDTLALLHTYGKKPTDFYLLSYRHISKLMKVK